MKVVATSASLDAALFRKYLNNCPLIEIPGKTFPVNVVYDPPSEQIDPSSIVREVVARAIAICRNQASTGDILCFLTGQEEVEKAKARFEALAITDTGIGPDKTVVLCLYGRQMEEEQQKVFETYGKKRKVIFATDVAETSITIDGLAYVVDAGLTKENVFNAATNASALKVLPISKSRFDWLQARQQESIRAAIRQLHLWRHS